MTEPAVRPKAGVCVPHPVSLAWPLGEDEAIDHDC